MCILDDLAQLFQDFAGLQFQSGGQAVRDFQQGGLLACARLYALVQEVERLFQA